MEIFKRETKIDFLGLKKYTGTLSIVLCIISLMVIFNKGLNFGLEFTGGTQIEMRFQNPIETGDVQKRLYELKFDNFRVQHYGSQRDILLRLAVLEQHAGSSEQNEAVLRQQLVTAFGDEMDIRRIEYVGSEVGKQLAEQGGMAVLVAILATMVYIALRFEYRFAMSAAAALCHDAIIVVGIFSFFAVEFDLAALAAILAVLGYSLNDTIVVFDRVRENFRKIRKESVEQVMNISINQTLSRTIMTSWLTLLVVLALLFFGGESLFSFSLVLCIGIVIGTYSSIYVAGACAMSLGLSRSDMMPRPKSAIDDMP